MESHLYGHCHSNSEGDDSPDHVNGVVALLLQADGTRARAGVRGGWGGGGDLGPDRRVVVVALVLVQSPVVVVTAEAVVTCATAIDEVILCAVEGEVILAHHIIVTSAQVCLPRRRHLGC